MNHDQILKLRQSIQSSKPDNKKETEELCDLALLGIWTKEHVLPLLRKLPPTMEVTLPPVAPSTEAVKSTVAAEVDKVFKACPQPPGLPELAGVQA